MFGIWFLADEDVAIGHAKLMRYSGRESDLRSSNNFILKGKFYVNFCFLVSWKWSAFDIQ